MQGSTADAGALLIFLLIFLPLLAGFAYFIFQMSAGMFRIIVFTLLGRNPFRYFDLFPKKITLSQEALLQRHFDYYRLMPPALQAIFRNRLYKFIAAKRFETRQRLALTEEMKMLVSASAVQLTFGLSRYLLKDFPRIIIYPEAYYSLITKKFHKGEANTRGLIVLSWQDFKEGYNNPHDNRNLGLHEFAHALFISFHRDVTDDVNLLAHYDRWKQEGDKEFFRMRAEKNGYLRSYAGTNPVEFFAVSIEYFFEAPNTFKKNLPELYQTLARLLAQDPSQWIKA